MLSTLLATLPCDFYICFSSGGEDGKKTYTSCVKRLKSELSSIKSVYGNEIRQLFPLTPKPCSDYCEDCHCAAKRQPSVGEGQGKGSTTHNCANAVKPVPCQICLVHSQLFFRIVIIKYAYCR